MRLLAASTFEWIRALVAPVLGATAVVIAATIAARTANRRQALQLQAEGERQQEHLRQQFDHDSRRLEQELGHERSLKDREELRAVLDDAAAALARLIRAWGDLVLLATAGFASWNAGADQRKAFHTGMFDAIAEKERTVVRLGRDHIVVKHYDQALDHLSAGWNSLSKMALDEANAGSIIANSRELGKLAETETDAFSDRAFEVANAAV